MPGSLCSLVEYVAKRVLTRIGQSMLNLLLKIFVLDVRQTETFTLIYLKIMLHMIFRYKIGVIAAVGYNELNTPPNSK